MKKIFLLRILLFFLLTQSNIISADFKEIVKGYKHIKCELKPIHRKWKKKRAIKSAAEPRTSFNWSGYVAATSLTNPIAGSVNNVTGSFIVPTVKVSPQNTFSTIWVGIDGFFNNTVEQIGVEADSINGKAVYFAWFELFPKTGLTRIAGFPVFPGDSITVSVSFIGNSTFMLSIANNTRKVFKTIPTSQTTLPGARRTSAEWIVEDPTSGASEVAFADFTPVTFFNSMATINGATQSINGGCFANQAIIAVNSLGQPKAVPSALSKDGRSFTVTRQPNS